MSVEAGLYANLIKATEKDQITWVKLAEGVLEYRPDVPTDVVAKAPHGHDFIKLVKPLGGRASAEISATFFTSVKSKTFASTTLDKSNLELLWTAAVESIARRKGN